MLWKHNQESRQEALQELMITRHKSLHNYKESVPINHLQVIVDAKFVKRT